MRTVVVTGSASGIGAATRAVLEEEGARVIGVDLHKAEVEADLSRREERARALRELEAACGGSLEGVVACAGISGSRHPGSRIVAVNYFGAVELLAGLRPALARGQAPAAVAISSNSVTTVPGIPETLVEACLEGGEAGEARAQEIGDRNPVHAYAGAKTALTRWVRRQAVGPEWAGAGIPLNAVAPGRTRTAMDDEMLADPKLAKHVEAFPIPAGRPGQAAEVGRFVAYLLGPHGRFFCGSFLFIDGGTDALLRGDAAS